MSVCKSTLIAVKENYDARIEKYINSLYNKSFEEITDKDNPMHKVGNIKFLNVKRRVNSETEFDIEINREGYNKLILREAQRIERQEEADENIIPPLPPASMLPGKPSNNNKYNYSSIIKLREDLKDEVDARILTLKNQPLQEGRASQQLKQIAELQNLSTSLYNEIKASKTKEKDFEVFINNILVDAENIELLLNNPTLENLVFAEKYITLNKYMVSKDKGGFLKDSYVDLKKKNPLSFDKLEKARQNYQKLEDTLRDHKTTIALENIEFYLKQKDEYKDREEQYIKELALELYEKQKEKFDINKFELHFLDFDKRETFKNAIFLPMIKKLYDDSIAMKEKQKLVNSLGSIRNKVKEILISKGMGVKNLLGEDTIDWSIFYSDTSGRESLIGRFNFSWQKMEKDFKKRQKNISKLFYNFTAENSDAQLNTIDKHYEDITKEGEFIDYRKMPEIVTDSAFSEFSNSFSMQPEARKYKQELIDKIGKRGYEKLLKESKDNIHYYMAERNAALEKLYYTHGVDNIQKLEEKLLNPKREDYKNLTEDEFKEVQKKNLSTWNFYLQEYYTKSPFIFAENHFDNLKANKVKKHYYMRDKTTGVVNLFENNNSRANLQYSSFIPKAKHLNEKYQKNIVENGLEEAWELMDEGVEFVNKNGMSYKGDNSFNNDLFYIKQANSLIKELKLLPTEGWTALRRIINRVKKIGVIGKWMDPTAKDRKLSGGLRTISQVVEKEMKLLVAGDGKEIADLDDKEIEYYREIALNEIQKTRKNDDLIENIILSIELAEKYKAKKEIETKVNFFHNQFKDLKHADGTTENRVKVRYEEALEYFINKNLYSINNRFKSKKGQGKLGKTYSEEHLKSINKLKDKLKKLKKLEQTDTIKSEIIKIEKLIKDEVDYITVGGILEALLFKLKAMTAFSLNFSAQFKNRQNAHENAEAVDGKEGFWKAGVYPLMLSKSRLWKNNRIIKNKKEYESSQISEIYFNSTPFFFQNSAHELYKYQRSRFKSAAGNVVKDPKALVGETEKYIQKPMLLALLSDIEITDKKGNKTTIVDPKTGLFNAFKIVDNQVVLKDSFDSPKNRETFLYFSNQEAANIFGESGRIPNAIAYINGDYKDSTAYKAEDSAIGAVTLMFRKWMVKTYTKKSETYQDLAEEGQHVGAVMTQLMKGWLYGTAIGASALTLGAFGVSMSLPVTVPVLMATGISYYILNHRKQYIEDLNTSTSLMQNASANLQKAKKMYNRKDLGEAGLTAAAIAISSAAQSLSLVGEFFTGKTLINSDKLKQLSTLAIDKKDMGEEQRRKIEEAYYYLQTKMAFTLRNMMFSAGVYMIYQFFAPGFDDDEEKEKFKLSIKEQKSNIIFGEKSALKTAIEYPKLTSFYIINNLLSSMTDDISLTENWKGVERLGESGAPGDLINIVAQITEGEYDKGPNAGRSRAVVAVERYIRPSGYNLLGFGSAAKKDFNKNEPVDKYFATNLEKLQDIQEEAKKAAKVIKEKELYEDPEYEILNETDKEKADWIKKKLTQFSRKEYPSLNLDDFYTDGTLTDQGMIKIRNYEDKIPKKLKSKIFN